MSIQPIDLQTLFMRLIQVGKEQAIEKEAVQLAQTARADELARQSETRSQTVNETDEIEHGPEQVKEEDSRNKQREESASHDAGEKESKEKARERQYFKDPDLGSKLDISG